MESSTPPSQLPVKTSYRGITSDQMVLTKTAMNELRSHLSFTQLRFHCSKNNGRTFHMTSAANSTGEAVVQPASCGSYVRMENDNSRLARVCQNWALGKWGHAPFNLMKRDYTTTLLGFLVFIIGRLIIKTTLAKRKDGNAMMCLLAWTLVISGKFTFAKLFVCWCLFLLIVFSGCGRFNFLTRQFTDLPKRLSPRSEDHKGYNQ